MAKNDAIDAEVTNVEAKDEKKKPGFFSKMKDSLNNSMLENKIEQAYKDKDEVKRCHIYTKDALFPKVVWGTIDGSSITVWGEEKPETNSVLIDDKEKAYYVGSTEATTVKSIVEGVEYERPATVIALDENVVEVKVVKAGDRYFIYNEK